MKVSIALATFNGSAFIETQIKSLLDQTSPPDEIVVCDDRSEDGTADRVRTMLTNTQIEHAVVINGFRKGYTRNFSGALEKCTGDLVFPCDQDDYWYPQKISRMLAVAEQHPDADVFLHDADLSDQDLQLRDRTKLQQIDRIGMGRDAFFMGCCTAIRRRFLDRILPIPDGYSEHDRWIITIARNLGRCRMTEESLIIHRRHGGNQSGHPANRTALLPGLNYLHHRVSRTLAPGFRHGLESRARDIELELAWLMRSVEDSAEAVADAEVIHDYRNRLQARLVATRERYKALQNPRSRRAGMIWRMLRAGHYRHFSGLKSALRDLTTN